MKNKITLQELVQHIAEDTGNTKTYTETFLEELTKVIEEGLLRDGQVAIAGLGTFRLKWVKEKAGRNAQTGEVLTIPPHSKVVFKAEKLLRESINHKYAHLEPRVIGEVGEEMREEEEKAPSTVAPKVKQNRHMNGTMAEKKVKISNKTVRWVASIAVVSISAAVAYLVYSNSDNIFYKNK